MKTTIHTQDLFTPSPEISPDYAVPVFRVKLIRERDHLTRQITSSDEAGKLACEILEEFDREAFLVMAFSTATRLLGVHVAHLGTLNASVACGREIYRFAILANAKSILCAHNHPSGNLEPSKEDVAISRQLKKAGHLLDIELLDSLIIGFDGHYTSLAARGLL